MVENDQWWDGAFSGVANQLTKGVLNEMKKRILDTKNTRLMREFFEEELKRYQN
jgi:hypothetical protein